MATIRVTCPTCGKLLEVDARHEGEEVECGECFQIFVAEPNEKKSRVVVLPVPVPAKRRDDEDDLDEDAYDRRPARHGGADTGSSGLAALGVFVGILALLTACCPPTGIGFGIAAMVLGGMSRRHPNGSGAATAASVLGSIAFLVSVGLAIYLFAGGGLNRLGK